MRNTIKYKNGSFRIAISFLASFYILIHGRSWNITELIQSPLFRIAFLVSFVVTILLVTFIHYVTVSLDKHYKWLSFPVTRFFKQFLFGVVVPLLIDFSLLSIYFYFIGSNIFENGFLQYDFPVIICFILFLNTYYAAIYLYKYAQLNEKNNNNSTFANETTSDYIESAEIESFTDNTESEPINANTGGKNALQAKVEEKTIIEEQSNSSVMDAISFKHDGIFAQFKVKDEVMYFYSYRRKTYLISKLGREYSFNEKTIEDLEEELRELDFCKTKRSVLVNSDVIRGYSTTSQRDTFRLILKKEYEDILPEKNLNHFFLSRAFLMRLKNKFEKI